MSNWKDTLNDYDLTTSEGLEAVKRLFVEQSRAQQIESLKQEEEAHDKILDIFGAIKEYNDFIDQPERNRPKIVQWDDIPEVKREWLIHNWMPANTVTMFTGEGGAGKSWLTLQAVCQVCCGFRDAYLDPDFKKEADVTARRDVVFATYEDEPEEIKRRLQALASGMPVDSRFNGHHQAALAHRGHARHRLGVGTRGRQAYPKHRRFAIGW